MSEQWLKVCETSDLVEGSGVCALLSQGEKEEQVALFKITSDDVYAISNFDPFGEVNVLSRGIVGSIGDELVVASPLYKQHFSLESGRCLEDESVSVSAWPVRIDGEEVLLKIS